MKYPFLFVLAFFVLSANGQQEDTNLVDLPMLFALVDRQPVYVGCEGLEKDESFTCMLDHIMKYIEANFKYPKDARKAGKQGRINVNFVIEKDGTVSNVELVNRIYPSLDAEALRVVRSIPTFSAPAIYEGKPVRMQYTVPINAKLQ